MITVLFCGAVTVEADPVQILGDLNGDGHDDVLLRHTDGRWFYYPMDGRNSITDERGTTDLTRNLDWQFAGIGDLNGDGRDDVLLRNTDGRWFYYPMDGRNSITDQRGTADLTRNLDWQFAGIGDLNEDGRDDVLLRHTDGRWFYYPMDGRNHITGERGTADLTRNLDWQFAGMGDLNEDGRDDVLLRHTDGRWFYYPMDGRNSITDQRGTTDLTRNLDWQFAGIGDLNGDGRDDVFLRHTDGRWFYYPMDGRNSITEERGTADLTRNLDWRFAGIGDLNGDGHDDVLLRHTDGRWFYYPMDGRNHITGERGTAGLTRNLDWSIAGADMSTPEPLTPPPGSGGSAGSEVVSLSDDVNLEMVSIPGGTFQMGDLSGEGYGNERPVHTVTVRPFKLGKYEVTVGQWDACLLDGGCNNYLPYDYGYGYAGGLRPVIDVSLLDAIGFIDWLNDKTDGNFRLPTEAEWEYAARAGSTTEYSWGDNIGHNQANCGDCGSPWDETIRTAPVGSFPANAWGLHDMHGNVWEWVGDCWHPSYEGAPSDGSFWFDDDPCNLAVIRGGGTFSISSYLRSAFRFGYFITDRHYTLGFRLAQDE